VGSRKFASPSSSGTTWKDWKKNEPDLSPAQRAQVALGCAGHAAAGQLHAAGIGPVQAAEQVQQRRLARAGTANDGHRLATRQLQVDAVEGNPGATPAPIGLAQTPRMQDGHGKRRRRASPAHAPQFGIHFASKSTREPTRREPALDSPALTNQTHRPGMNREGRRAPLLVWAESAWD
jgi:hypothetical protein